MCGPHNVGPAALPVWMKDRCLELQVKNSAAVSSDDESEEEDESTEGDNSTEGSSSTMLRIESFKLGLECK